MTEEANMTESSTEIVSHEQQPDVPVVPVGSELQDDAQTAPLTTEDSGAGAPPDEPPVVVAADEQPEDQHPGQHWNPVHQMWMDN